MLSSRMFLILTILDSTLQTVANVLGASDQNDQGIDDEISAFLKVTHERIQAFLARNAGGE